MVQAIDHLLKSKQTKPLWEVIEEVIKVWITLKPSRWESELVHLRDTKETRKATTVGSKKFRGVSKSKGSTLAYIADIPSDVLKMIRILYPAEKLPFNKPFFRKFARKFPAFSVMEKI